jgi:hypothetical protein
VLEQWPAISAAVERHSVELVGLVEFPVALGRVDGAQRRNRTDLDELWRRWRARFPDDEPVRQT